MSVIGSNILAGASGQGGVYNLTKSLRFRSSASAYLNRTPASAGNRQIATWSGWIKRGVLSSNGYLFSSNDGGTAETYIEISGSDQLNFAVWTGSAYAMQVRTTQVFRDPSAWYHIVCALDTTQATASNRAKIYVNGVQVTALANADYPTQNYNTGWDNTTAHNISRSAANAGRYFDGYMAEINFIDGTALTPSSFGQTSTTTGVWQPKKFTGTYGTNGFYLDFEDTSSTAALGYDAAGSNDWTVNNISLTAGTTYDSMNDVPTLTDATTANFATFNPISQGSAITLSGGNLNTVGNTTATTGVAGSTFGLVTGKWYVEFTINATDNNRPGIGIIPNPIGSFRDNEPDFSNAGSFEYLVNGGLDVAGSRFGTFSSFTTGDIIGIAIDSDNGAAYVSKNNTWQNSGVPTSGASKTGAVVTWTPTSTYTQFVVISQYNTSSTSTNFGQRAFSYTPPTNFNSINTFNLPTPTIGATASTTANKYMDATIWTGNGASSRTITNAGGFQPDFLWIKQRSAADVHVLVDSVRGTTKYLNTNNTNTESTYASEVTSFDANGFTMGSDPNGWINYNNMTVVGWQWRASNATAVTNTAGTITSTVSANTTAGFSIVTYTGNGANSTVGHGLGVAPSMIIVKARNVGTQDWQVYHETLGINQAIQLNLTSAVSPATNYWYNGVTSTVFGVNGSYPGINGNTNTYVAYCFAQVAGYSAFGSYTGNGSSDGTFVYTGFRPRFLLIKKSSATADWFIYDTARNTYNTMTKTLEPNTSNAERDNPTYPLYIDDLSNGFKCRVNDGSINDSGATYIYYAVAENPFKFSNAR